LETTFPTGVLDVLVLGGGITGLGVARLAARNGWSVAVLERSDLASGASGASSHMLHGGLRYLEHARFALVREALAERAAVTRMAPALATPVRFLVPLRRDGRMPAWKLRAGLALYDLLAGRAGLGGHAMANAAGARALEPGLAPEGLTAAGTYADAVVDDARLAIAVASDAVAHGATIRTRVELMGMRPLEGSVVEGGAIEVAARDYETRVEARYVARALVNATGAWSDRTRRDVKRFLEPGSEDPPRRLKPSRGTHLVYPALTRGRGVLALAGSDGRAFFVVPFAGRSLVGTTEVETDSPPSPEQLRPSPDEIRYLAREVERVLPDARGARPLAVYAGVRPLLDSGADVGNASREHETFVEGRLVTVAGGKYTTFRVMARDTLARVARVIGRDPQAIRDSVAPLPVPLPSGADPVLLGARAAELQWARRLDDVLRRRSTHWLDDDRGLAIAPEVAGALARRLGWSPEREREELDRYEAAVREEQTLLSHALEG
jgi:glycerol-3-phosphate dehydrogenase